MADIMITARDRMSDTLRKIEANTRQFSTSLEDTNKKLDMLNKNKVTLKIDAREARKELSEAMKDYDLAVKSMNSSAEKMAEAQKARENVIAKSMNYEKTKNNLKAVSSEISKTESAFKKLGETKRKLENETDSTKQLTLGGFVTQLIGEKASQISGQAIQYYIGSAFGNATGNILSNMLSGGVAGFAMGSVIPVPGSNIVGAAIGAGAGAFQGALQNLQAEDNVFKSAVSSEVDRVKNERAEKIQNGSAIAAQRETDKLAFTTLLKGDPTEFLNNIVQFSNTTPFFYDDLTKMSQTLLTYDYTEKDLMPTLKAIGNAGATLGKSSAEMDQIATVLGRMNLGGDLSTIQVKMLQNYGVKAYEALGQAWGISTDKARDKVSGGGVDAKEAAKIIVDYMTKNFDGAMEKMSQTFNGLSSTVEGLQQNIQASYGKGYNEIRKEGLKKQIDYYQGDGGQTEDEFGNLLGQAKAQSENAKELIQRQQRTIVQNSEEYKDAIARGKGAEAGRLIEQADLKAESIFNSSKYGKAADDNSVKLIETVREGLNNDDANWKRDYAIQQELSKGMQSVADRLSNLKYANPNGGFYAKEGLESPNTQAGTGGKSIIGPANTKTIVSQYGSKREVRGNGHAAGINYVPYNGYNAVLHEGERVLTARENRNYKGTGNGVVISGNNFTVREEADIDKIARALLEKIEQADLSYVG